MLYDLTFAIGDVHGCLRKLTALLTECETYAGGRTYRVIALGDYVDRGPESAGVVRLLRDAQMREPDRMICVKGNHEDMLVQAAGGDRDDVILWLQNGGTRTLRSYGVEIEIGLPPDPIAINLPAADVEWMRHLPLFVDDGLRFFTHAGIDPAAPLNDQNESVLLWTRARWPEGFNPGRLVVHGHTPQSEPKIGEHILNIDTGAVSGGDLTAAVFDNEQVGPLAFITHDGRVTRLEPPASGLTPKQGI